MSNLYGHNSFDSGYVVNNYPWGFRLKTSRKYWIETTKRGDRFCYATLNPKTNQWCKPKKSTYYAVMVMFLNDKGHVDYNSISAGWSDEKLVKSFLESIDQEKLSTEQQKQLCYCKTVNHVNTKIKFSFENTSSLSEEERQKREEKEKENKKIINNYANKVYYSCLIKNKLT
jgi:hypothetical protein